MLLPFICGILLYDFFSFQGVFLSWLVLVPLPFLLFLLFYGSVLSTYRTRWIFGVFLSIQILFLGYYLSVLKNEQVHHNHFSVIRGSEAPVYSAYLLEPPQLRANSAKILLKVHKVFVDGKANIVKGKLLAYSALDAKIDSLDFGTEIMFSQQPARVSPPANPGEFNYARYLSVKNVFHQVYLGKGSFTITGHGKGHILKAFALRARNRLLHTMQQYGITGHEFAVAAALLIGYDDMLDATQRREYSGAGVVHILCVSGLHVGVVFLIADWLFFFLRKQKKAVWLRPVLIILVIWLYALITGLAPSVMRASLMFSLITIGKSLNRQSHTYNTLAASAFILLVLNPGMLYDLGFQLSYAAVAGIVTFQPPIHQLFIPSNKFTGYVWGLISVSIAAQLITVPISVYYFHQFPNYFLLANLVAIPLAGVLIYSGVLFIFLSFIPFLGKISATLLVTQVKILNFSVAFVEGLPGAVSRNLYLSPLATLVSYLLLFSCLMWYLHKNKAWIYVSLIACLLLAADHAQVAIRRSDQKMLVVQSLNRHSAIGFIKGNLLHILADSAVVANPALLNYPMEGFRIKLGIRHVTYSTLAGKYSEKEVNPEGLLLKDGFFQFRNIKGVVISPAIRLPVEDKQIRVDYVILTSNSRHSLDKLKSCFPGATFVADASGSIRKNKFWKREAARLGLTFYSVRELGALVVEVE